MWCTANDWSYWSHLCDEVRSTRLLAVKLVRTSGDEAFGAAGDGTDEAATGFSGDSSAQTTDPMGPWADSACLWLTLM